MPDAKVLVAGSDHQTNHGKEGYPKFDNRPDEFNRHISQAYEFELEVFTPPYLLTDKPRPAVANHAERIDYAEEFLIEVRNIEDLGIHQISIALMAPGSVTHSFNSGQRHVGLEIVSKNGNELTLKSPPNSKVAPPTVYMLFVVADGVPSEAVWLQLQQSDSDWPDGPAYTSPATALVAPSTDDAEVWLDASNGIEEANGVITKWRDQLGNHDVTPVLLYSDPRHPQEYRKPRAFGNEINGNDVVRFTIGFSGPTPGQPVGGYLIGDEANPFLPGRSPYHAFVVMHAWPPCHSFFSDRNEGGWYGGPWADVLGWGDFSDTDVTHNAFVGLRLGPSPRLPFMDVSQSPPIRALGDTPKEPGKSCVMGYWNTEWEFGTITKNQGVPTDPLVPVAKPVLLETFFNGHYTGLFLNGNKIKEDEAPVDGATGNGPLRIGFNGNTCRRVDPNEPGKACGALFRGDFAEILIYKRAIPVAEQSQIREYFRLRYDLWAKE